MLPDLPVLAFKLRDYLLMLLPAYLLGVGLTAQLTALLARHDPAGLARAADAGGPAAALPGRWLLQRLLGAGPRRGATLGRGGEIWILTLSTAATPLALLLTAAIHPGLALLRLAGALVLSAVVGGALGWPVGTPRALVPGSPPPTAPAPEAGRAGRGVWRGQVGRLLDEASSALLACAAVAALVTAWRPATQAITWLAGLGPLAAVPATLAALLVPLPAGSDVPLTRALQTYDVPLAAVVALQVGAPLLTGGRLRSVAARYGRGPLLVYLLSAAGGCLLLATLAGSLFAGAGFLNF